MGSVTVVKASRAYKRGDWNFCRIVIHGDGSYTYHVGKHSEPSKKFRVRNLNKPNEEILEDEEM